MRGLQDNCNAADWEENRGVGIEGVGSKKLFHHSTLHTPQFCLLHLNLKRHKVLAASAAPLTAHMSVHN
jgi:hypothetical protein